MLPLVEKDEKTLIFQTGDIVTGIASFLGYKFKTLVDEKEQYVVSDVAIEPGQTFLIKRFFCWRTLIIYSNDKENHSASKYYFVELIDLGTMRERIFSLGQYFTFAKQSQYFDEEESSSICFSPEMTTHFSNYLNFTFKLLVKK